MATTRIMPLHVGKGRTESRAISDIIDYVANPKKTDNGRLITGYACDSRTADAEFLLAKRLYITATGRVRGADDVIAYHVRQSFRPGEITPEEANQLGVEYIFVNKELQRVTRGALDDLSDKGVIKKFPPCIASTHTALVLKEPKTKTSIRRVYLPKTVAYMLVERKKEIDELMELFGDEYIDNNLVFCSSNGRPMESQVINRAFNKLIKENGLPHVVFHSLRHSSITYKLKLNGGDMKSVQGDSGHAQVKMVADVYSHIIDEDRCINAQRLEEAFYSSKTPDPVEDTEPKTADTAVTESDESDAAKILELLKNPETAALLKQLAKAL